MTDSRRASRRRGRCRPNGGRRAAGVMVTLRLAWTARDERIRQTHAGSIAIDWRRRSFCTGARDACARCAGTCQGRERYRPQCRVDLRSVRSGSAARGVRLGVCERLPPKRDRRAAVPICCPWLPIGRTIWYGVGELIISWRLMRGQQQPTAKRGRTVSRKPSTDQLRLSCTSSRSESWLAHCS